MKMEKLKLCPFCGGKATVRMCNMQVQTGHVGYYVGCYSKKCSVNPCAYHQISQFPDIDWSSSKNSKLKILRPATINAWNKRADDE